MKPDSSQPCCDINRRQMLVGAGIGVAATSLAALGWFGRDKLAASWNDANGWFHAFRGKSAELKNPEFAMPGPYEGRVVEINHPDSVTDKNEIQGKTVHEMVNRGMCALTGADLPREPEKESIFADDAWRRLFKKGDVVGIKVNPVGRKPKPSETYRVKDAVGSISSPEVVIEIVRALKVIGIPPQDIVVFERYANEFRDAGYERMMYERDLDKVRWAAAASQYKDPQLDIEGFDEVADRGDKHVVGYDPDAFVVMNGFCDPAAEKNKDERRFRSHLSMVVARMVNKFITIPVLKDHRSAGVTLSLKNMSHGMNNNVARSHIGTVPRIDGASGPNQCNTFIPTAVNQPLIRQKATLHIMDGLIGVYEGGPGCWNKSWGTWQRKSLFFATDPVAMDMVGWPIIDAERRKHALPPVESTGIRLMKPGLPAEQFDWRTPQHIILAGNAGLGQYNYQHIDHRVQQWDGNQWQQRHGQVIT
jgi:uncharacterized protein (DUF362 family)